MLKLWCGLPRHLFDNLSGENIIRKLSYFIFFIRVYYSNG
jgi:hypothetical protein